MYTPRIPFPKLTLQAPVPGPDENLGPFNSKQRTQSRGQSSPYGAKKDCGFLVKGITPQGPGPGILLPGRCPGHTSSSDETRAAPPYPQLSQEAPGTWPLTSSATLPKIQVSHTWAPSQASGSQAPSPSFKPWGSQEIAISSAGKGWMPWKGGSEKTLRQRLLLLGPNRPFPTINKPQMDRPPD